MKLLLALIILATPLFASCYFDSNLGYTRCLNDTPQTSPNLSARTLQMALTFREQGITPETWRQMGINGLQMYLDGKIKLNITETEARIAIEALRNLTRQQAKVFSPSGPILANGSASNGTGSNHPAPDAKSITPTCQNDLERDWQAYCQSLWAQGMQLDCVNTNAQAKAEIMQKLEQIKGCKYV